jgi:radical SAM protein with 4Fe4S-binding SPASM domain
VPADAPGHPSIVQIEVDTECNLACPMCPRVGLYRDRPRRRMPLAELREVFLRDLPGPHLTIFSGFSEALLNPDLWPMMELERSRGARVFLGTNGHLVDRETAARLVDLGVDRVILSLEALDETAYRRTRGARGSGRVLGNLAALAEASARGGGRTEVAVNFVVTRSTLPGIARFLEAMADLGVREVSLIKLMDDAAGDPAFRARESLGWDAYEALDFVGLADLARRRGVLLQWSDRSRLERPGCDLPRSSIYVTASWDVAFCPFLAQHEGFRLGSLLESSLAELLASERAARLRQPFEAGSHLPACEACACLFACSEPERGAR